MEHDSYDSGTKRHYEFRPGGRSNRPVTDYGSTMVHWMRHRRPGYAGSYHREVERPSVSYIVDVGYRPQAMNTY